MTSNYQFQNTFFYLQLSDDPEAQYNLRVLKKTRHKIEFHPQTERSKYICVPRNINEVGNHFIWEFFQGKNFNVPTKFGYLHHYRYVCEEISWFQYLKYYLLKIISGVDDHCIQKNKIDQTMFAYQDELSKNVNKVVGKLLDQCQINPLKFGSTGGPLV